MRIFPRLLAAALLCLAPAVFASEVTTWSTTSDNNNSTPPNGWPEGMQYSQVNNTGREMMGAIARWRDQVSRRDMNSGATDPGALGPYSWWADTGTNLLKQRNAANSGWSTIAPLLTQLAPTASPALTGTPTAPTAANGTNNTQLATTAFVQNAFANNTAGKASTLAQSGGAGAAMTFFWSGQGGQPSWLWGSNDGFNHYVYNPANFSVNYANSAGYAGSATSASTATSVSSIIRGKTSAYAGTGGTVSFGTTFSSPPTVIASIDGITGGYIFRYYGVTTTGFSYSWDTFSGTGAGNAVTIHWIAYAP